MPDETELNAERASWGDDKQNAAGAFASKLNWPVGGLRRFLNDELIHVNSYGYVWGSSVSDGIGGASGLIFTSASASVSNYNRANGWSVRCVKE